MKNVCSIALTFIFLHVLITLLRSSYFHFVVHVFFYRMGGGRNFSLSALSLHTSSSCCPLCPFVFATSSSCQKLTVGGLKIELTASTCGHGCFHSLPWRSCLCCFSALVVVLRTTLVGKPTIPYLEFAFSFGKQLVLSDFRMCLSMLAEIVCTAVGLST